MSHGDDIPLMYDELAEWWPLLSAPADYEQEATWYRDALRAVTKGPVSTVLELGSGGGNNASFLRQWFDMTLVDLSAGMLEVSAALNPDCTHVQGDMRSVRLDVEFDAVLVHDAIMYMASHDDLSAAIVTAAAHCRPDGGAVFVPDFVRETFKPQTSCGGHDAPNGRGLRYLSWLWDPDPNDTSVVTDYAFLVRDTSDRTRVLRDRHVLGLFPSRVWTETLTAAGFEAQAQPFQPDVDHDTFLFSGRLGVMT